MTKKTKHQTMDEKVNSALVNAEYALTYVEWDREWMSESTKEEVIRVRDQIRALLEERKTNEE